MPSRPWQPSWMFRWRKWDGVAALGARVRLPRLGRVGRLVRPARRMAERPSRALGRGVRTNVTLLPPSGDYALTVNAPPASHPRLHRPRVGRALAGRRADRHRHGPRRRATRRRAASGSTTGTSGRSIACSYGYPLDMVEKLEALTARSRGPRSRAHEPPYDPDDRGPLAGTPRRARRVTPHPPTDDHSEPAREPNRADLGKDPARVSGMFDQVAGRLRPHQHGAQPRQRPRSGASPRPEPSRRARVSASWISAAGTGASSVALDPQRRRGRRRGLLARHDRRGPSPPRLDARALVRRGERDRPAVRRRRVRRRDDVVRPAQRRRAAARRSPSSTG